MPVPSGLTGRYDIENRFPANDNHPNLATRIATNSVRIRMREMALWLHTYLPEGEDKNMALIRLEESMFWACAAHQPEEPSE